MHSLPLLLTRQRSRVGSIQVYPTKPSSVTIRCACGSIIRLGTACTPSRGALLSGLYPLQTYTMLTERDDIAPGLDPRFPTFAWMLRLLKSAYGDRCFWFGKWHLSGVNRSDSLADYGFRTGRYPSGAYPSPNGWPNEGASGGQWPWKGCTAGSCGPSASTKYLCKRLGYRERLLHFYRI